MRERFLESCVSECCVPKPDSYDCKYVGQDNSQRMGALNIGSFIMIVIMITVIIVIVLIVIALVWCYRQTLPNKYIQCSLG